MLTTTTAKNLSALIGLVTGVFYCKMRGINKYSYLFASGIAGALICVILGTFLRGDPLRSIMHQEPDFAAFDNSDYVPGYESLENNISNNWTDRLLSWFGVKEKAITWTPPAAKSDESS